MRTEIRRITLKLAQRRIQPAHVIARRVHLKRKRNCNARSAWPAYRISTVLRSHDLIVSARMAGCSEFVGLRKAPDPILRPRHDERGTMDFPQAIEIAVAREISLALECVAAEADPYGADSRHHIPIESATENNSKGSSNCAADCRGQHLIVRLR
jgi:hypothetical protein